MPDEEKPEETAPEQATPNEQTAAQEGSPEKGQAQQQQQEQPKFVTEDSLNKVLDERDRRQKQGNRARQKAINEQFDSLRQVITAQGQKLSPEQEAAMRAGIEKQYDAQESEPQAESRQLHPLASVAFPIMRKAGVTITDADPEFEALKPFLANDAPDAGTLGEFVTALNEQIAAKKERTEKNKSKASARAAGGGGSQQPVNPNDISKITDSGELYLLGEKQMREARRKH